jgi:hypothetical protein
MYNKWFGWEPFHSVDELKLLGWVPGVYAIRLFNYRKQKPEPISRLIGEDESGILQIGVSKKLGKRLVKFFNSCYNGAHSHSEGERMCLIRLLTQFEELVYPESSLQYCTKWTHDISQAKLEEEKLLKGYFKRFGELPPLNSNVGNQHIRWSGKDVEWDTLW